MTHPSKAPRCVWLATLLAGLLAGCAAPVTTVEPTTDDTVYMASGRYPAEHSGILIAQNAALSDGRDVCVAKHLRFRPLASVAGEDPATGEAVYLVRFRCILGRVLQAPLPGPGPDASGKM